MSTENPTRRRWLRWASLATVILVLFGASWVLSAEYDSEQTARRTFVVEQDFTKVRKIMVRTDAAKEIITMGGTSEFVEQQWNGTALSAAGENIGEALLQNVFSNDPDWELQLEGTLQVRTLDDYVGRQVVTLQQDVSIDPDEILSKTKLLKGSERLLGYAMTTRLAREEDHTRIDLELTQKIRTHAPWFAHRIADRRVRASAENALEKQQTAMIELIDANKDKSWLFPLR